MIIGPSRYNDIKEILEKNELIYGSHISFSTLTSANKNNFIENQHWVSYCISNFQEKTVRKMISEITNISVNQIFVDFKSGQIKDEDVITLYIGK